MKKKLAAILAALMVLSIGVTTIFAASSPDTSEEAKAVMEGMTQWGYSADSVVCVGTISGTGVYKVSTGNIEAEWIEMDASNYNNLESGIAYFALINGIVCNISYDDISGDPAVFYINGLTEEDAGELTFNLYVMSSEYRDDLIVTPKEGATTSSASSETNSNSSNSASETSSISSSPKTGDAPISLAVVLLIGGIAIVSTSRKKLA